MNHNQNPESNSEKKRNKEIQETNLNLMAKELLNDLQSSQIRCKSALLKNLRKNLRKLSKKVFWRKELRMPQNNPKTELIRVVWQMHNRASMHGKLCILWCAGMHGRAKVHGQLCVFARNFLPLMHGWAQYAWSTVFFFKSLALLHCQLC